MDHLPLGTARPAGASWGAPPSSELVKAPFLGGRPGLGCCVLLPAGLPGAVWLWKACRCPVGLLSFLTRPSHPAAGGLLRETFPLVTSLHTNCLKRGGAVTFVSIIAFRGAEVDTGRSAFRMFSGCFLGKQGEGKKYLLSKTCRVGHICSLVYIKYSDWSYSITMIVVIMIRNNTLMSISNNGRLDNLKVFPLQYL